LEKANFYRVFPVSGTLLQVVPLGDGLGKPDPRKSFSLSAGGQKPTCQARL